MAMNTPKKSRNTECCSINFVRGVLHIFNLIFFVSTVFIYASIDIRYTTFTLGVIWALFGVIHRLNVFRHPVS